MEARLYAALSEQHLGDDSSNESEPEGRDDEYDTPDERDITEHASWYCTEQLF
jgi:hypothetical protein